MKNDIRMFILGGYSKYNINLVNNMVDLYSKDYQTSCVEYDHWYHDGEMDYENQLQKIRDAVKDKNIDVVVAKSIGTYLSTKSIKKGFLNPKLIVFLGYPKKFLENHNLSYLEDLLSIKDQYKILFIQQESDPLCNAEELKQILNGKIPVITIPGNDHSYSDVEGIKKVIDEFIKSNLE